MRCQELVELVTDYLEDRLSDDDRARFETHVGACRNCREYFRQMRETIGALGTLTPDSISPEVQDELLAAFRDWKRS